MDTAPTPPPAEVIPTEPSSLTDRLTNVIAAPKEVFTEVAAAPVKVSNWLVPLILSCAASLFYFVTAFSQPSIAMPIREAQEKAMQQQVQAGKMTQEQADKFIQMSVTITKFVMPAGGVLVSVGGLFLMALLIWAAVKFSAASPVTYMKILEVCGLALVIDVVQKLIRGLLIIWKGNFLATLSPTLFMPNADIHNKTHVLISVLDVVDIWWIAVLGLGVSKAVGISYGKATGICAGIWFGFRIIVAIFFTHPA